MDTQPQHILLLPALLLLSYFHVSPFASVLVTGAGELQQRENGFAVRRQDHGEPHRSGLEPRDLVHGHVNNFPAADAHSPPPQEQ